MISKKNKTPVRRGTVLPWKVTSSWLPSISEVLFIRSTILQAIKCSIDEWTLRWIVEWMYIWRINYPTSLKVIAAIWLFIMPCACACITSCMYLVVGLQYDNRKKSYNSYHKTKPQSHFRKMWLKIEVMKNDMNAKYIYTWLFSLNFWPTFAKLFRFMYLFM